VRRTVAAILAELREVERHLAEAPPHSGTGVRDDLARRRDALQRELARARTNRDSS
jgi:hypothetical protein